MTFPSIDSAITFLRDKMRSLFGVRAELNNRLTQIEALLSEAVKSKDQQAIGKLIVLKSQTGSLLEDQAVIESKVNPFLRFFGAPTLGFLPIPVYVATGAIAVASMLYLHFEKIQNQKTALDMIAKGMLRADEAEQILNPGILRGLLGGGFGSLVPLALIGGGLLFYFSRRGNQ